MFGKSQNSLDVENPQTYPLLSSLPVEEQQKNRKRNIVIWSTFGVVFVFLIIMTVVFSRSSPPACSCSPADFAPVCHKERNVTYVSRCFAACGGVIGFVPGACPQSSRYEPVDRTDDLGLCRVDSAVPQPLFDYRNHSRMVQGQLGMVAADQSRCSDVGAGILDMGGNAVDAAVATVLCQGVVNPFASGIGGGHFMLVRLANGTSDFINAREVAPAKAHKDLYQGMPANASLNGGLAVAVPMELKGLELAWKKYGSLPWRTLVQPAARIAQHGFAAHPYMVHTLRSDSAFDMLLSSAETREAFLIQDNYGWRTPRVGELCCIRPRLADTLTNVAQYGAGWLYDSARANALAQEIQAAGGIMTAEDIMQATPRSSQTLTTSAGGLEFTFGPPPSSASVMVLALKILEGFPNATQAPPDVATHRLVESMKHAFALRMQLADPGTPEQPYYNVTSVLADILSDSFASALRGMINDSSVLPLQQYGGPWNPLDQERGLREDHGTTHIAVVDKNLNAVSVTSTINTGFGSGLMSASTGILLNNEMDDFSRPDMDNKYGLAPSVANYIAAGKIPLSSMSPVIITKDGKLLMVVGASNGPRIPTAIIQTVMRSLFGGQDLLSAVSGPRLHNQFLPNRVMYESYDVGDVPLHFNSSLLEVLRAKGNEVLPQPSVSDGQLGNCQAILLEESGRMIAVSDPRKDGAPAAASKA